MDDGTFRKQVSYDQMKELLEFLQEYPNLAKGLARGQRGKIHSLKLWNQCSKKLNQIEDGASKTAKGWSKYWCDWKYRVRRKALAIKVAKENNRPLPDGFVPLSDMDKIIVELIGESAINGVVIKSIESLENDDGVENTSNDGNGASGAVPQCSGARPSSRATRSRKRRNSAREISEDDVAGPSCPCMHGADIESDDDVNVEEFIRMEKRRLEFSRSMAEFMKSIATNMTRLTDAMLLLKDSLHDNMNRVNMN